MNPQLAKFYSLSEKVAVVTGGASGIGAAIVRALAEMDATVVIADIDVEQAKTYAASLSDEGFKVSAAALDLFSQDSIASFCKAVIEQYGSPWVLVNNAGLQDRQAFAVATADEWDRMQAVNARGPFLLSREFGRAMIDAKDGGRIVNVASAVLTGSIVKGLVAYAGSKGAMLGLSGATAFELAEFGITVNTVLPGGVMTPGAMAAKGPTPEGPARRPVPLGMCEAHDIAAAVAFFASPAARRITNQVLAVDGGFSVS